jgi:outer membrane protein assembly factor BamB
MWKALRAVGLGAVVVALAGCWPAPGAGPDRRSFNPLEHRITVDTVSTLAPTWTATVDHGGVGPPVVSTSGVHVSDGQAVYGFDSRTGARLWKNPPVPDVFGGTYQPVVVADRLLVAQGDSGERIYATMWLDPATGEQTGVLERAGQVDGVRGSTVLLHEVRYGSLTPVGVSFVVIDADDGSLGNGGLIEAHDGALTGGLPLTLGRQRVYQAGVGLPTPGPTPPTAFTIGVRAFSVAPAPATCGPPGISNVACPLWATELDGNPTGPPVLAADESTVYAGTDAGTFYALDTTDGHVLWQTALGGVPTDAPALARGTLYVPVAGGRLVALAAAGCGAAACPPVWTAATGGSGQQPAVAGDVVFVATNGGTVDAFAAAGCGHPTCPALWSYDLGAAISGDPAISGGQLYVGTTDRRLVAFAPHRAR